MSIALTGTSGAFTRFGYIQGNTNALYSSLNAAPAWAADLWSEYPTTDQNAVSPLYPALNQFLTPNGPIQQYVNTWEFGQNSIATQTLISQIQRYQAFTPSSSVPTALGILIQYMAANSFTINKPTIALDSAITPNANNIGTPTCAISFINPYGDQQDMCFTEIAPGLISKCVNANTPYAETFTVTGQPYVQPTSYLYPQGSGANTSVQVCNAAGSIQNLITDGGFAQWTMTNTPVQYTIITGAAGTQILQGTTGAGLRTGTTSLQIVNTDNSTVTQLKQAVTLQPLTVYAFCVFLKLSTLDTTNTGRFQVALVDGSSSAGTIIQNAGGWAVSPANNAVVDTIDGSAGIGTSYKAFTGFFQTPRQLPSTGTFLRFGWSIAPGTHLTCNVDLLSLVPATLLYQGGPYFAMFSGLTPSAVNDYFTIPIQSTITTVSGSSQTGTSNFVIALDMMFNLRQNGLYFPSTAYATPPTILDSLIPASP
jgi:hypothetical protein